MKKIVHTFTILAIVSLFTSNCDKDRGFIFMPITQEVSLGEQLDSTIMANPTEYPLLDKSTDNGAQVYAFIEGIMTDILNNTKEPLKFKEQFNWKLTIIDKDELNAFAAPGGYLYVYTGILKYLDNASEIAGIMGHEMAHADLRHSARQMQKTYGVNFAASILFGSDKSQLEQILSDMGSSLAGLQFSRSDEYQADEFSVRYLAGTNPGNSGLDAKYDPRGVSGFFQQLEADGKASESWEILSTHPSGANRVEEVILIWENMGSPSGNTFKSEYDDIKALLP